MLGVRPYLLTGSLLLLSLLLACDGDPLFGPNAALLRPPARVTSSAVSHHQTAFRVERSLDLGSTWTRARRVGANVTSVQDYEVASEQQVCYRVVAFNALGDSPPATTDCTTPPAAPTALTAAGAGGAAIDLTWADNSASVDGTEEVRRCAATG